MDLLCCYALLMNHNNGEPGVDGYNPSLLSVRLCFLRSTISLAEFNVFSLLFLPCRRLYNFSSAVLHDQMFGFEKLILSDNLSGFLTGHSRATALLKMTKDFRASLDNKDNCMAIAVDLSRAFDSISHNLLISKLKAWCFTENAVDLIRSYLCDWLPRVNIGNIYSDWKTIQHGVPQGSVLGPLLFNLFINDPTYSVGDAKLRVYADDTTLYPSHPNQDVLESRSQSKFDVLQSWFKCNYLSINESKTKALPLGDNPTN